VSGSIVSPSGGSGIANEHATGTTSTTPWAICWNTTSKSSACDSGNRQPPLTTLTCWID
jgi:hypothetical protein